MKNKIALHNLGCKLNYAENSTYERKFTEAGHEIVHWSEKADIYLVNTCTVTEHSDKKCRNFIRKLHRQSPDSAIVVTGCYAELQKEEIYKIDGVKYVFGAKEKSSLVPTVLGFLDKPQAINAKEEFFSAYSSGERTRTFLKVQDGCNYFCAYCTIPYARGNSRNSSIAEVIKQAEEIASKGIKEIVLTGVNTGDFGKSTGETFIDLIKALNEVEGIDRYRISSIEPNLLSKEIVDWIASGTKFLPHFHIPLQSGTNEVLKAMNRRYTTEAFKNKIDYIRQKMGNNVFFGIDVIVGFPGETDELFEQCYNFLRDEIDPAFIHIFPYSVRSGTPAATMPNQVSPLKKKERAQRLKDLSDKLHSDFVHTVLNTSAKVLFESTNKNELMFGYTENYVRIQMPYNHDYISKVVEVDIKPENLAEVADE